MRAVISVIGKDAVGILAGVAAECERFNVNITDVTQSILQDMFVMVMMTDISDMSGGFADFSDALSALGEKRGLSVRVMHEDIFNAMHTV